jgi:uncharacterized membrane protein YraQ (UPF0718 family)
MKAKAGGKEGRSEGNPRGRAGIGMKFLLVSCLVYVVAGVASPGLALSAFSVFLRMMVNILPALALVFGMMLAVNLLLEPGKIARYLGKESGAKGWLIAIGGGILSAGPIYAWYPMLAELRKHGMKDSLIAAFLYNRAVKIPLMPLMVYYFGWMFTAVFTFYIVVFSIINGLIVGYRGGVKHEGSG